MSTTINGDAPGDLGITSIRATHQNLADGRLILECQGMNADDGFLFDYKDRVVLRVSSTVRWAGPCVKRSVAGEPGSEKHVYEIASPWWYLDQQTYLQEWKINGGSATAWLARCIVGLASDGTTRQSIGTACSAIVSYAASCGWPVTAGTISISDLFPVEELRGMKCTEALRTLLRWAPDVVGWWTFGTESTDDALNLKRRSALTGSSLTVGTAPLEGVPRIHQRDDLIPEAIVIQYERTDTVDGSPVFTTSEDVAPSGADGRELGAAIFNVTLAGGSQTFIKQRVHVRTLPLTFTGGGLADARQFWGRKMGLIGKAEGVGGDIDTPNITFELYGGVYVARTLADPDGYDGSGAFVYEDPEDSGSTKIRVDTSLSKELVDGLIMPWMTGIKAQSQNFLFKIHYKDAATGLDTFPELVTVTLTATNASNRVYQQLDSSVTGEAPVSGLAEAMLDALAVPHYEGTVNLVATDVPATPALGNVLNISGGRSEWASMNAVVQAIEEDFDTGKKVLTLGAPEHLGPQDAIELQRANRRVEGITGQRAANASRRNTGIP